MNYKVKGALRKSKNVIIVTVILWFLLTIVLVSPLTVTIVESTENGLFNLDKFMTNIFFQMGEITENLGKILTLNYAKTFWKAEGYLSVVMLLFFAVGFVKSMPKNEYTDIENGSSDWARGEEFSVLSKKKGILLAENHYLPVDKRGNVNVLVVGRFRFSENLLHMLYQMHINFWDHMFLQIQRESFMIKQQDI